MEIKWSFANTMKIRAAQWNIGGSYIRSIDTAPDNHRSYNFCNLSYISEYLQKYNPDVIAFQEIHCSESESQAEVISQKLGLNYFVLDSYDVSHVNPNYMLSQSIISRFPIVAHSFELYPNLGLNIVVNGKDMGKMHDKGATRVTLKIENNDDLEIITTHLPPFRKLKLDPKSREAKVLVTSVDSLMRPSLPKAIIMGDFNYNEESLKSLMPSVFGDGIEEVLQKTATTPKGRCYDHVLFKGVELLSSSVCSDALTDHYPIISEFEI